MQPQSREVEETLSIRAEACEFARASAWLESICNASDVPVDERYKLDICMNEALANVLAHGGIAAIENPIFLTLTLTGSRASGIASLGLHAGGVPFDPALHQPRPAPQTLEEAEPGGLGVLLMRTNADRIAYERRGDLNCMSFLVRWGAA